MAFKPFRINREKVDTVEERTIIANMIVSSDYCRKVMPLANPDFFQTPYTRTVYRWIKDYFEQYGEAPGKFIQDKFYLEKKRVDEEESELIETMLMNLSEQYEDGQISDISVSPFLVDKAELYFKSQSIRIHKEKLDSLYSLGKIDEAYQEISNFKKVVQSVSSYSDINDPSFIEDTLNDDEDKLFKFPGALGEMFGYFCREWLVAVQARYAIGKTFTMREFAYLAQYEGWNVFEFNLEMSEKRIRKRHYRRIMAANEKGGLVLYPVMDCYKNQIGTCNKSYRASEIRLYHPEESKPRYGKHDRSYRPCTHCRNKKELKKYYESESWFTTIDIEPFSRKGIEKRLKAMSRFGGRHMLRCYPRFSANLSDIERELDIAAYAEDFYPDVIIVDYADILAPEDKRITNDEQRLNETWMRLAGLAQERKCLVVTATQVKTEALKKKKQQMGDASGSARAKYGHTDLVMALNQSDVDKANKIMRFNAIKMRDEDFNPSKQVFAIQQLELGLPIIDSEWLDE